MPISHRILTAVSVPLAATVLAGCGSNPFDASDLDSAAPGSSGPPEFGEISEELFATALSEESVTLTSQSEGGDIELDSSLVPDADESEESDEAALTEILGALDGTATQVSFTAGDISVTQIFVDSQEYVQGADFAPFLLAELDEEIAEEVSEEFVEELIGDQWVQFDDEVTEPLSAEKIITSLQQELTSSAYDQMTAQEVDHDGDQGWLYEDEDSGTQVVVTTDEQDPQLMQIVLGGSTFDFSQWDESPIPEAPEEVITADEIIDEMIEEAGWTPEDEDQA